LGAASRRTVTQENELPAPTQLVLRRLSACAGATGKSEAAAARPAIAAFTILFDIVLSWQCQNGAPRERRPQSRRALQAGDQAKLRRPGTALPQSGIVNGGGETNALIRHVGRPRSFRATAERPALWDQSLPVLQGVVEGP
jgi:hypothetical protein